ncbi:tetratricopeptide repeat protein [Bacillus sp. 179-C3.3 HS]|uniref:response regulator aspartate phosphatase n=1 Tax=Bacillus sp. 179-C3.3 HS TaxID=3232162 RepID=UPI00399F8F37
MAHKIPSSEVGVKINQWYTHICKFEVEQAKEMKQIVEEEIYEMEEDQDLLLYYSLIDFRHQMMLQHLSPVHTGGETLHTVSFPKEIEDVEDEMTGLLGYYFHFFHGMYAFIQRRYTEAISYYKLAEHQLNLVTDEIEKAEFFYKIAEVYYHMKQTYFSMHYAKKARDIYKKHQLYGKRSIQCDFVMAGNWIDVNQHQKALPYLEKALKDCETIERKECTSYFKAMALNNLGTCHYSMGTYHTATVYFEQAIALYEKDQAATMIKSLFSFALTCIKLEHLERAEQVIDEGWHKARLLNDEIYQLKFQFLQALYLEKDSGDKLTLALLGLKNKKMFADLEELALDAANYYKERDMYKESSTFFEVVIEARTHIQKGDEMYENEA